MKEGMKLSCKRCKAKRTASLDISSGVAELLGWVTIDTFAALGQFDLCPHCAHELKRFLAGCEIKKLDD